MHINCSVFVKGPQRYIVLFDDAHHVEAYRSLGKWASHPDLNYTWWDCARQAKSIRKAQLENTASTKGAVGAAPPPVRRKSGRPGRSRKWRRGGF